MAAGASAAAFRRHDLHGMVYGMAFAMAWHFSETLRIHRAPLHYKSCDLTRSGFHRMPSLKSNFSKPRLAYPHGMKIELLTTTATHYARLKVNACDIRHTRRLSFVSCLRLRLRHAFRLRWRGQLPVLRLVGSEAGTKVTSTTQVTLGLCCHELPALIVLRLAPRLSGSRPSGGYLGVGVFRVTYTTGGSLREGRWGYLGVKHDRGVPAGGRMF